MSNVRRVVLGALLLVCLPLFADSADQAITNVTDSADPVTPGQTLIYTIDMTNNGPDAAVNGGLNVNLPLQVTYQGATAPAGFTCFALGSNVSCTNPSWPSGSNAQFTITVLVSSALVSFPDGSFSANFFPSGTTPDPNGANNNDSETTNYDTPQINLQLSVTDSPDPVGPNGNITYSVPVANNGPDTATNVSLSLYNNGSLRFQSVTPPAGWTCTPPAAGSTPTFSCATPSMASGANGTFTVVVQADPAILGIFDGSVQTYFGIGGTGNETNTANDSETETTAYVTPDADMSVSVTDTPDPVMINNNITYTIQVGNSGPDAATNATLNIYNGGTLQFQSISTPAGWSCAAPAVNGAPQFSCTNPSFANGGSSTFTLVLRADSGVLGIFDGTAQTNFNVASGVYDPDNSDNSETESTAYVSPDADLTVSVSDSPDPVTPDNTITYTVQVGNTGPDAATNAALNIYNGGTLKYQSITVPSSWTCTPPAVGAAAQFNCTNASFANGGSSTFTLVVLADSAVIGNGDTTLQTNFNVASNVYDPDNSDNSETEATAYDAANANLGITVTDSPDPVAGGANITYSGTITNAGPDAAANATLTVLLAPSLLFQSLSGPAGFSCTTPAAGANGTVSCSIASLASGASVPFTLVAQVNPSVNSGPDGTVQQTFAVSSPTNDPSPGNESVQVNTAYTTPDADISVTNSDAPDPVAPAGTITYTQTITNNGPASATNATFTQSTPAGTTFQSLAAAAGWSCSTPAIGATGAINCSKGSMTSGENASFTLVLNVTAGSGTITSVVTGDSDTYDPDNSDNTATAATTVTAPASADLSITNTTNATSAPAGAMLTYTISLHNSGPDAAANVVMTDTLPASLLFQSITAPSGFSCTTPAVGATGTITCTRASLPNGATSTFTLNVKVAAGATSGSVTNTAGVTSSTSDPDSGDVSGSSPQLALAPASADLSIVKSTNAASVPSGGTLTYTITVANAGPSDATNVHVLDTLPAQTELVSVTPSQGTCSSAIDCSLGTIANGADATITLRVRVLATSGTITNSASVSAAEGDPGSGDNDSTAPAVPVTAAAAADIPTLSEWALIALAAMLGIVAVMKTRAG